MTKKQLLEKLNEVEDPELGVGIVDLGLVYDVIARPEKILVKMTLTTSGCPVGPLIIQKVKDALLGAAPEIDVELVWDPPWTPERIKPEVAALLNIGADLPSLEDELTDPSHTPPR